MYVSLPLLVQGRWVIDSVFTYSVIGKGDRHIHRYAWDIPPIVDIYYIYMLLHRWGCGGCVGCMFLGFTESARIIYPFSYLVLRNSIRFLILLLCAMGRGSLTDNMTRTVSVSLEININWPYLPIKAEVFEYGGSHTWWLYPQGSL